MAAHWGRRAEQGERVLHGVGLPLLQVEVVDRRQRGGETVLEKQWREAMGVVVSGGRGLEWSVRSERGPSVVRTGWLAGGPNGFDIFLKLSKLIQTWKLKMDALR
jgi:hypothetical protein